MKISIDNSEFCIFKGAKLKDTIKKHCPILLREIAMDKKNIVDCNCNKISIDTILEGNEKFFLKNNSHNNNVNNG